VEHLVERLSKGTKVAVVQAAGVDLLGEIKPVHGSG
jgi:hypothetical protein